MKVGVYTASYTPVPGRLEETLSRLGDDVALAEKQGYSVYYCPCDFLGLDNMGGSYRARCNTVYECAFGEMMKIRAANMLLVLGFKGHDDRNRAVVLLDGSVRVNEPVGDGLDIAFGGFCISLADISRTETVVSGNCHGSVILLMGQVPFRLGWSEELRSFMESASRLKFAALFYQSGFSPFMTDRDVVVKESFCVNCYEIEPSPVVDLRTLEYQRRRQSASDRLLSAGEPGVSVNWTPTTLAQAPVICTDPLVKMEKDLESAFSYAAAGLANRMRLIDSGKLVLGLSGGVDSTAALFVAREAIRINNGDPGDIIAVSMPGLGTGRRTRSNARLLAETVGATFMEIPIEDSVLLHFRDIGHDVSVHDITYENAQARERCQILFDLANKHGALEIGTGDLSENMVGWCTYGGDQSAMYNVNTTFSKTQLQFVLARLAERENLSVVKDILDTPVSPELLPPDKNGDITQKSEDSLGPYEVVDFVIYLFFYKGYDISSCLEEVFRTFGDKYDRTDLSQWTRGLERRFYTSAFKRITAAPGPVLTKIADSTALFDLPGAVPSTIWKKN